MDSQLGRYQVVNTQMGDCLHTGKPFQYITNTKVNSALYPFGVGKSSTNLSGWCRVGVHSSVLGGICVSIWQVMLCSSVMGFP